MSKRKGRSPDHIIAASGQADALLDASQSVRDAEPGKAFSWRVLSGSCQLPRRRGVAGFTPAWMKVQ